MADSQLVQLCDAIVSDLNTATFDDEIKFSLKLIPRYDFETLGTLRHGWVMPAAERREPDARNLWLCQFDVQVGVVKKLNSTAEDSCDKEMRIVEQIADYYDHQRPTDLAMPLMSMTVVPFSQDHIDKYQAYLGAVLLTFHAWRE